MTPSRSDSNEYPVFLLSLHHLLELFSSLDLPNSQQKCRIHIRLNAPIWVNVLRRVYQEIYQPIVHLKLKCQSCGELTQKESALSLSESVPLPVGKGTNNLIQKWHLHWYNLEDCNFYATVGPS